MEELLLNLISEDPSAVSDTVKGYIDKYKPSVYAICKELFKICKDYANNDELYEMRATMKKKAFDAYKNAGFTDDQAIAFILNDNLQLVKNMEKFSHSSSSSSTSKNKVNK